MLPGRWAAQILLEARVDSSRDVNPCRWRGGQRQGEKGLAGTGMSSAMSPPSTQASWGFPLTGNPFSGLWRLRPCDEMT